jgi:hypothetical protein
MERPDKSVRPANRLGLPSRPPPRGGIGGLREVVRAGWLVVIWRGCFPSMFGKWMRGMGVVLLGNLAGQSAGQR